MEEGVNGADIVDGEPRSDAGFADRELRSGAGFAGGGAGSDVAFAGSEECNESGGAGGEADSRVNTGGLGILAQIKACFPGKHADVRAYSPLALAYIGDAVYDLIIRTVVVERANRPANELHRLTVRYVSAGAQSKIVEALMDRLTEEEQAVYRRGRNSKPHTTAKNASAREYLQATGFEAVLGYLYLADNMPRVLELIKEGIALVDINDNIFFRG